MKRIFLLATVTFFTACERIESGNNLKKEVINQIKSLRLLDDKEEIIKYYSNFDKDKAGNFFTNKRIAHYWLDENDQTKNDTSYAYYQDILSIDTFYNVPATFSPYMIIKKSNNSVFKVYAEGSKKEIKEFFEEAMMLWKNVKHVN